MGGFRNWCIYGCWDAPRNEGEGLLIKRTFIRNTLFLIEVRMQLRDSEPFQGLSDFGT